jgi:DNA-binding PadR family transcriptional regulator
MTRAKPATGEVLGGFEHQVLLTVLRLDAATYSVPIVLELEQRTGRTVSAAAVFVTLRRLEKRGLLRSQTAQSEPGRSGRPGRLFAITPAGVRTLRESRRVLARLWDGVTSLGKP